MAGEFSRGGRLGIRQGRIDKLRIGELTVDKLIVKNHTPAIW